MTVAELMMKLKAFPPDLEVKITDGLNYRFYSGDFVIEQFEDVDGTSCVDIGVGGFEDDIDV